MSSCSTTPKSEVQPLRLPHVTDSESRQPASPTHTGSPTVAAPVLVISHRGASGVIPEHTLEAYQKALDFGSRYIEPDLVMSKDGELWIRHELNLIETTNALDLFAIKKHTRKIDGAKEDGIFIDELTSAEVSTLRARQRVKSRDQSKNDQFKIVRFEEFLDFIEEQQKRLNTTVTIVPELKHTLEHTKSGLDIVSSFAAAMQRRPNLNAIVQSFEVEPLLKIMQLLPHVKTLQLVESPVKKIPGGMPKGFHSVWHYILSPGGSRYYELVLKVGLKALVKNKIDYVCLSKELADIKMVRRNLKSAGIPWIVFTLKFEDPKLKDRTLTGLATEIKKYLEWGATGVFTDESEVISHL